MIAHPAVTRLVTKFPNSLTGRDVVWGQYTHIDLAGNIACSVENLYGCKIGAPNITNLHYSVSYESGTGMGTIVIAIDVDPDGSQAIMNTIESGRLYNPRDEALAAARAKAVQTLQDGRGEQMLLRRVCLEAADRRGLVKAATIALLDVGADVCEAHMNVHPVARRELPPQKAFSMDLVVRMASGGLKDLTEALRRLWVHEGFTSATECAFEPGMPVVRRQARGDNRVMA